MKIDESRQAVESLHGMILDNYDRPLEVKYAENNQAREMRQEKPSGKNKYPLPFA